MGLLSVPQYLARSVDWILERISKLPVMRQLGASLEAEAHGFEGERGRSRLSIQIPGTVAILAAILYFVSVRIGHYFNWPPNVYRDTRVLNLTAENVTWDVFYGTEEPCGQADCLFQSETSDLFFQKRMVLPAREFPLKDYKAGETVFYRAKIKLPAPLYQASQGDDPLVFHSLYIWAKSFDFFINGKLIASGGQELLNLSIPRTMISQSGEVVLGFRINPGDLPYQGIAHRGDLVIGSRSLLAPTAFFAEERRTVFYLWFLLPKIAFCLMFAMLYLAVAQRSEIFFFCLYGFLSAMDVFFSSGYGAEMVPWVSGPHLELVSRVYASLALSRFVMDFFRRTTPKARLFFNALTSILTVVMGAAWLLLGAEKAMHVFSFLAATLKPAVIIHGAYSALIVAIHLSVDQRSTSRSRIAFSIGTVLVMSIPAQLYESFRWVVDIMGASGNTAGIYLYLVWIFDLILFAVLSAVMAAEFGMNLMQKKKLSSALDAIRERLGLAQSVQLMLMPRDLNGTLRGMGYRIFFHPAEEVSGDWFHVWQEGDRLTLFQGDVVGKGPSAALSVSIIVGILTECRRSQVPVDEAIRRISYGLYDLFGGAVTSTLAAVQVRSGEDKAALYAAGSVGWFLTNKDGAQYIPLRGMPLGQAATPAVGHRVVEWGASMSLFTFTDGCLEGSRALKQLMNSLKELPVEDRHDGEKLNQLVLKVGEEHVLYDDRTMTFLTNRETVETSGALPKAAGN